MANNLVRRVRFMMLGTLIFSFVLAFLIYQVIPPLMHEVNFFLLLLPSVIVVMIPMFRANPTYPEKGKNEHRVSILIPARDEEKVIFHTLKRLTELNYGNYEVIVIDDGSNDRTGIIADEFSSKHKNFKVVRIPSEHPEHGKAKAVNEGVKIAQGDIILILDADNLVDPNYLEKALKPFADSSVAGVQTAIDAYNTHKNVCTFIAGNELLFTNILMKYFLPGRSFGCGFLIRRKVLEKIPPLRSYTVSEDEQMTASIKKEGSKLVYCTDAVVHEHVPESFRHMFKQRKRWFLGSMYELLIKNRIAALLQTVLIILIDLGLAELVFKPFSFLSSLLIGTAIAAFVLILSKSREFSIEKPVNVFLGTLASYSINLLMYNYVFLKLLALTPDDLKWYKTPKTPVECQEERSQ